MKKIKSLWIGERHLLGKKRNLETKTERGEKDEEESGNLPKVRRPRACMMTREALTGTQWSLRGLFLLVGIFCTGDACGLITAHGPGLLVWGFIL